MAAHLHSRAHECRTAFTHLHISVHQAALTHTQTNRHTCPHRLSSSCTFVPMLVEAPVHVCAQTEEPLHVTAHEQLLHTRVPVCGSSCPCVSLPSRQLSHTHVHKPIGQLLHVCVHKSIGQLSHMCVHKPIRQLSHTRVHKPIGQHSHMCVHKSIGSSRTQSSSRTPVCTNPQGSSHPEELSHPHVPTRVSPRVPSPRPVPTWPPGTPPPLQLRAVPARGRWRWAAPSGAGPAGSCSSIPLPPVTLSVPRSRRGGGSTEAAHSPFIDVAGEKAGGGARPSPRMRRCAFPARGSGLWRSRGGPGKRREGDGVRVGSA